MTVKVKAVSELSGDKIYSYQYDDRGFRIRKQDHVNANPVYVRDGSGSILAVYREQEDGGYTVIESPVYGASRLGTYYRGTSDTHYELKDHLGSVRAVIKRSDQSVYYYANYYPFGFKMQSNGIAERFGYQGEFAEEDPETGFNHFELRQFDPVIGRWLVPDPERQFVSPYLGMGNNPIVGVDPNGDWVFTVNATFMGQYYLKGEFTISYAVAYDPATGKGSISKLVTLAPGLGLGAGVSAGTSVSYYHNLTSPDQLTGTSINMGAYGGILGMGSVEANAPKMGNGNFFDHAYNMEGGTVGVGAGAGFYADMGFTMKEWEISFDELQHYQNHLDDAVMDLLNYQINKNTMNKPYTNFLPPSAKNYVRRPMITVEPVIQGEALSRWSAANQ